MRIFGAPRPGQHRTGRVLSGVCVHPHKPSLSVVTPAVGQAPGPSEVRARGEGAGLCPSPARPHPPARTAGEATVGGRRWVPPDTHTQALAGRNSPLPAGSQQPGRHPGDTSRSVRPQQPGPPGLSPQPSEGSVWWSSPHRLEPDAGARGSRSGEWGVGLCWGPRFPVGHGSQAVQPGPGGRHPAHTVGGLGDSDSRVTRGLSPGQGKPQEARGEADWGVRGKAGKQLRRAWGWGGAGPGELEKHRGRTDGEGTETQPGPGHPPGAVPEGRAQPQGPLPLS